MFIFAERTLFPNRIKLTLTFLQMKNYRPLIAVVLLAAVLQSCRNDIESLDVAPESNKRVFKAYSETVTRTTMGDNYSVIWSENDEIRVTGFTETSAYSQIFTISSGAGTTVAEFEGELGDYECYIGMYPRGALSFYVLSRDQLLLYHNKSAVFDELNFIDEINPMVAYTENGSDLQFKNILGIVEFKITGTGNIVSLKVTVDKGEYISGMFLLDVPTCTLTPYTDKSTYFDANTNYSFISAGLKEPITLSSTPRSIYALLPPGTYHNLSVQTIDDTGMLTTRTATNDITVVRSQITRVSEFTHNTTTIPYVAARYAHELSDFYISKIEIQTNSLTKGIYYANFPYDEYESMIATGKTDKDIVLDGNYEPISGAMSGHITLNETYMHPNTDMVVLCAAIDENQEILQEVSKCVFTVPDVPYTSEIEAAVNEQTTVITENSIALDISTNLDSGMIMAQAVSDELLASYDPRGVEINTVIGSYYKGAVGSTVEFIGLQPSTDYTVYYTVTDADTWIFDQPTKYVSYLRYSNMGSYKFTTPAHTPSAATVSLEATDIQDVSATITATLSEGSKKMKYYWDYASSTYPINADHVAVYGTELTSEDGSNTVTINLNTKYETGYVIYAVAYDENDSYGVLAQLSFTTTALVPTQDPEYTKFLGTYIMTYSQSGQNWSGSSPHTVTISQAVEGRLFNISGLMKEELAAQYSMPNTIEATFHDGKLRIPCVLFSQTVSFGDVQMHLLSSDAVYIYYNETASLETEFNDGVLTPKYLNPDGNILYDGLYWGNSQGYIDYYVNIVLTKTDNTVQ